MKGLSAGRWMGYRNLRQSDILSIIKPEGFAKLWLDFAPDEFGRVLPSASAPQGWVSTMPVNLPMVFAASRCSYFKIHHFLIYFFFFPPSSEGADLITRRQNRLVPVTPRPVRCDVTLRS